MSIPFIGTGGLYTRLGRIGGWLLSINTYRGNTGTAGTNAANIQDQFQSTDQDIVRDLWDGLASLQTSLNGSATFVQSLAQDTIFRMVQDDVAIDDTNLFATVAEVIRQMEISSDKVEAPTCSVTVTSGNGVLSNTGDGVCIATIYNEKNIQMDYVFAEKITAICNTDSQAVTGAATKGQEPFTLDGETSVDPLSSLWPLGSGTTSSLTAISSDDDATQDTNLLTNGDWEQWTTNTPANWQIALGTAGVSVFKGTPGYRGSYCLQITGDGTELTSLTEAFDTTGQTTAKIAPLTVYGVNTWIKMSATPAAGVLEISIVDGSDTIVQDDSGSDLKITQALTAVSTTWIPINGFFRTPRALPTTAKFRVRLSTALEAGKNLFVDDTVITQADRAYNGGPYLAIFSGTIPFIVGDQFNLIVTNTYTSEWQKMAERLFGMRDLNLQLPSTITSGSVTIPDSLIG